MIQFLPLAGAIAVARRSVPAAGLFLGWLLGYVVVKGAADVATVESGSYWRLIMPGLPAFVLLAAAIPLLVPTFPRADGRAPCAAPRPSPGPAHDLASSSRSWRSSRSPCLSPRPSRAPAQRDAAAGLRLVRGRSWTRSGFRPTPGSCSVDLRREGAAVELAVDRLDDARTHVLPRLPRVAVDERSPTPSASCEADDRCELRAETLTHDARPHATSTRAPARRGLPDRRRRELARRHRNAGDVFALSPPAAPSGG